MACSAAKAGRPAGRRVGAVHGGRGTKRARDYHRRALAFGRDIGAPLEGARALEGIGHGHLHDHDRSEAAGYLEQAREVYRRIGTPGLARVEQTLRDQGLASTAATSARDHQ